jgi:uncharacterized membrane protein
MWLHEVIEMVQVSRSTANHQEEVDFKAFALGRKIQSVLLFRLLLAMFSLLLTVLVQSRRGGDLLSAHLQALYFFSGSLFLFTGFLVLDQCATVFYGQIVFDVLAVTTLVTFRVAWTASFLSTCRIIGAFCHARVSLGCCALQSVQAAAGFAVSGLGETRL